MKRLILLGLGLAMGWMDAGGQPAFGIYGTYSNLARSQESGDLDGYELTLVAQPDSAYVVFECAQGAPSKAVFVPVHLHGKRISFRVEEKDNACDGAYTGVLVARGLRLHSDVVGDTQFVLRRKSFWASSEGTSTKYERATDPLFDLLAAGCPAKNLEEMAPADLDLAIENFTPTLTAAQRKRVQARAEVGCKDSIAGVGCGNVAFLEVAKSGGFLPRFARSLCAADMVCTGEATCGAGGG